MNGLDYSSGVGFIDGDYCPKNELRLPISDLGFLLSDMCYDAVHVWKGSFFRLEDHLDRFERSIAARQYNSLAHDRDGMRDVLMECVRRSGLRELMVYLIATRGEAADGLKDLRDCHNRFVAWAVPYYAVVTDQQMRDGVDIVVSSVPRVAPEAIDPTVKNFARLDFVHALLEAYEKGCPHAVLLDSEGHVTEGRGWNIFALHGGTLVSPDSGVLEGITRSTVMELADQTNVKAELGKLRADDLRSADEVFMASTAGGLMPIRKVDDSMIGNGAPGPVTERLTDLYWAMHDDPKYSTPVDY